MTEEQTEALAGFTSALHGMGAACRRCIDLEIDVAEEIARNAEAEGQKLGMMEKMTIRSMVAQFAELANIV